MNGVPPTAAEEWRRHWTLALSAMIGLSFYSFMTPAAGLFFDPLHREFGWSRTQLSAGMTIGAVLSFFLSPFVGALIDRWGSRRLALPGIVATSAAIAAFGFANGAIAQWLLLWGVWALVSMAVKSTVWSNAITGVFSTSRGLALGVTLSGTAAAQVILPPVCNWLITDYGWRTAFVVLGLGWGGVTLIFAVFFLFDLHDHKRAEPSQQPAGTSVKAGLPGLTIAEAWQNPSLWKTAVSTLLIMTVTMAVVVHQFPIIVDAGMSRADAAWIGSMVGVAGITGKLISGWLLDRVHTRWVGGVTLASTAVAYPLLIEGIATPTLVVVSMLISGYAAGTKIQICNYLTVRYAGMRNFGAIFGVMASVMALAGGAGPVLGGLAYDQAGSYAPLLWLGVVFSIASAALVFTLGPYPDWTSRRAEQAFA